MSQISNRFFVTALSDGSTLHGTLSSNKSLTQAWNGSAAVPDWGPGSSNQPTIYLTLMSGNTPVTPTNYKWYYNGEEVRFGSDDKSTSPAPVAGKLQETTYTVGTTQMPALKIIGNVASSSNVDIDIIRLDGSLEVSGSQVGFSCSTQIRITATTATGSVGIINSADGNFNISAKGQTKTLYAQLFSQGTEVASGNFTTKWTLMGNNDKTNISGTTLSSHAHAFQVSESDVVDIAVVKCEFYRDNTLVWTEFQEIDDTQDPEYMYIYNSVGDGSNQQKGNAASLRSGESVTFTMWVGTMDDDQVLKSGGNPVYKTYKVKLMDRQGNVITGNYADVPTDGGGGLRTLSVGSDSKASLTLSYDFVSQTAHNNLTGIVIATT